MSTVTIHVPDMAPEEGWDEPQKAETIVITDATEFAYDGCHKFYLIRSDEERATMVELGYDGIDNQDMSGIFPIDWLPEEWERSCGLRFISSGDLTEHYVEQCLRDVEITVE